MCVHSISAMSATKVGMAYSRRILHVISAVLVFLPVTAFKQASLSILDIYGCLSGVLCH